MQDRERERPLLEQLTDRSIAQAKDLRTEHLRQIDAGLERATVQKTALQDRVNGLKQQLASVDNQLREINGAGDNLATAFEKMARVPGLHYAPGAGPELDFTGNDLAKANATRTIGKNEFRGDQDAIVCSPAGFWALEIAGKGKIPSSKDQDGVLHMLDVRTDAEAYEFYKIWNSSDKTFPESELFKLKGPIAALRAFGIGREITQLRNIVRGDIVQRWVRQKDKSGAWRWSGHVLVVTEVTKDGITLISARAPKSGEAKKAIFRDTWKWTWPVLKGGTEHDVVYFGRLYDQKDCFALEQKDGFAFEDPLLGQRQSLWNGMERFDAQEHLLALLSSTTRLRELPEVLQVRIVNAATSTWVKDDQYVRAAEYLQKLPDLLPDGSIKKELTSVVRQDPGSDQMWKDRATLERQALAELGRKEQSIQSLERVAKHNAETVAALGVNIDIGKRMALKQDVNRSIVDIQFAKLLVAHEEHQTLATVMDNIVAVINRNPTQQGLEVIKSYLLQLKEGLTKEQQDMKIRFEKLKGDVANAWHWKV